MAPLPLWLLWLLLPLGPQAQKLPTRNEARFQRQVLDQALFQDSAVLPDGAEVRGYLFRDTPKRYFFMVEEDNTPLSVTVTPCDTPLEWRLSLQELPEEASGQGSGEQEPEPLEQQRPRATPGAGATLLSYRGNDVEAFAAAGAPAGLYRLELLSTERDAHFRVYATTTPASDRPYPELPRDPRVDVTALGRTTATLAWKPSPTATRLRQPVAYCVVVGREHNFKSLCAVEARLSPDDAFMAAPRPGRDFSPFDFARFGFPPGSLGGGARGPRARPPPRPPQPDLWKVCVGNKTAFTVSGLRPGTQYYFDVFVANARTNASTAYVGTFARTREEAAPAPLELKDGKATEVFVKRRGAALLRFAPAASHQKVALLVHACLDAVRVQVRRDGRPVLSQRVEGVRQFLLRGRPKATYLLRLTGGRQEASVLKVLATTRPDKHAFPPLPEDTRIKAFDRLRTCSSATVAWLGTQERSKFCLYKRELGGADADRQGRRARNQCLGPDARDRSEKVLCKYFHSRNPQRAVTTETVRGLQPGRAYLLDVYLVGHGGHSVRYQSKVVKTRRVCS
ncbi:protein NDNF [Pipistrellus kuhlii]|uniref:Protein NDNF n=1 Tax=Pipistrellus kuhlii TaxID=59472 RepID=A0A7J7UA13_PIPKU|nr:protein NDNF [Pipistrellus kuhlii]KAF6309777.1 neuron derived neurotrophic factor [Pipistrellus kuhlii]